MLLDLNEILGEQGLGGDADARNAINAAAVKACTGLAPATVRHAYRAVFKSVLTDAIDDGLLARSPCHPIELPAAAVPVIEPLTPA